MSSGSRLDERLELLGVGRASKGGRAFGEFHARGDEGQWVDLRGGEGDEGLVEEASLGAYDVQAVLDNGVGIEGGGRARGRLSLRRQDDEPQGSDELEGELGGLWAWVAHDDGVLVGSPADVVDVAMADAPALAQSEAGWVVAEQSGGLGGPLEGLGREERESAIAQDSDHGVGAGGDEASGVEGRADGLGEYGEFVVELVGDGSEARDRGDEGVGEASVAAAEARRGAMAALACEAALAQGALAARLIDGADDAGAQEGLVGPFDGLDLRDELMAEHALEVASGGVESVSPSDAGAGEPEECLAVAWGGGRVRVDLDPVCPITNGSHARLASGGVVG